MDRFDYPRCGDILCGVLIAISTAASGACREAAVAPQQSTVTGSLRLACERRGDALDCRAIGARSDDQTGSRSESDLTDVVAWSTTNPNAVGMLNGRVTANRPGIATIAASMRSGEETLSSSALVVVTNERPYPQLAYDLAGVVRDPSNSGLKDVELTLMADREPVSAASRKTGTVSDGAFHFAPLLSGQYRLRASKQGYRPVERRVTVPDATPLTVVLISEAR
jgi:hypothetical protein